MVSCYLSNEGTLARLPVFNGRKVGTTSSQYGPYAVGYTRATIPNTKRSETVRRSKSQKVGASPDRGLQFALVKPESLVIAYQTRRDEYVPGSCTHRPSSHLS